MAIATRPTFETRFPYLVRIVPLDGARDASITDGFFTQVNEMYEKEMTMVGGFGAAAGPGGGGGGETSEGRVQELETLLDEYRRLVAADGDGRPADVELQVRGLKQQVQALTEQLEQARSQVGSSPISINCDSWSTTRYSLIGSQRVGHDQSAALHGQPAGRVPPPALRTHRRPRERERRPAGTRPVADEGIRSGKAAPCLNRFVGSG